MPDSYAIDIRIGARQDGELIWEPVRVQVELDKMAELEWRQKTSRAFPAMLVAKPFKWSAEGVIQIDVTIDGHKAKAIYDPGCSGVAISQAWASKRVLGSPTHFPITIASAEGVSTIHRTVFTGLKIKWKGSEVCLPAVILPGVGFDVLLGMSWITAAGVGLNAQNKTLTLGNEEYKYEQMSLPVQPEEPGMVAMYAADVVRIEPWSSAEVNIHPFDQGHHGGHMVPALPPNTRCPVEPFTYSRVDGVVPPFKTQNLTNRPLIIQKGQKIGLWVAAHIAPSDASSNKEIPSYFLCIPVVDLESSLIPQEPVILPSTSTPPQMVPMLFDQQVRRWDRPALRTRLSCQATSRIKDTLLVAPQQ